MESLPGAISGVIRRPHNPGFIIDKSEYITIIPNMVAHCADINPGINYFPEYILVNAPPPGSVFRIGNGKMDIISFLQAAKQTF